MRVEDNPSNRLREKMHRALLANRPADQPDVERQWKTFAIIEMNDKGEEIGWAFVYIHPGWAYIDELWVDEIRRRQGLGRQLMAEAESEAIKRGCHSAYLWTQDFEAPGFYEKLGYTRFVVMEDFIPGHQRIGYRKRLAA